MATQIIQSKGGEITFVAHGEDLSGVEQAALEAMLVTRKARVEDARDWTATARRALMTSATDKRHRDGAVAVFGSGIGAVRAVAINTSDTRFPAKLRQLKTAFDEAERDEQEARVALSAARAELKRRNDRDYWTANAARHAEKAAKREADRDAALRQAVTNVVDPPKLSVRDRIDAVLRG